MSEVWKPVPGFEGLYEVSDQGSVRSVDRYVWTTGRSKEPRQRLIKGRPVYIGQNQHGYRLVWLWSDNKAKVRTVHSLVAEAFVGPRPAGKDICHNDGDLTNNTPGNLRYDTRSANHFDKHRHGTCRCLDCAYV